MNCLICNKPGKVVTGVNVYVVACQDHANLYRRLEANYKARSYGDNYRP